MNSLVHGILESKKLEYWKYMALGSWNSGNLISCILRVLLSYLEIEGPANNFESCIL